jgi:RNA polymerase sigma-70 factor (ECF subfamily)
LRHEDDALDAVQDAMLSLVQRYSSRPEDEWPGLFYRILENRIRDMQRHRSVRARVLGFLPRFGGDEAPEDRFAAAPDANGVDPHRQAAADAAMQALYDSVATLPGRQREAFVLRSINGLSVEAAAQAMGVSPGSVKTHLSRALGKLREHLSDHHHD